MSTCRFGVTQLLLALGVSACFDGTVSVGEGQLSTAHGEVDLASVRFDLWATTALAGASVQICGQAGLPATPSLKRCRLDLLEQPADPDSCPCFALDLGTPEVTALCPTQWTFDYEIFSGPSCSGARLNPDPPPALSPTRLVCYDASALRQRIHPNQSVDTDLSPGANTNHVLCLTCSAITRDSDPAPSERYDCGCTTATGAGSGCTCSSLGVTGTPPTLPSTCTFANTACEITCSSPPSP